MPNITYHELANYNNGSLVTKTFELAGLTAEEHSTEVTEWLDSLPALYGSPCEEWIVCDYEDVPAQYVGTWSIDDAFFDYQEAMDNSHLDADVFAAAAECDIEPEQIEDRYQGEWSSDEDFVQQLLEDCGTIPADLPCYVYIDWTSTARDIMMDYSTHEGHYFSNH